MEIIEESSTGIDIMMKDQERGKNIEEGIEKNQGIDMMTGDKEKKVKVQEDTEAGTTAQGVKAAVEEGGGGGQGTEVQAQGVEAAAEGEAVMAGEAVGPAMGINEKSAQRPKVMGGLL